MIISDLIKMICSNIKAVSAGYKHGKIKVKSNENYLKNVGGYSFWKNTPETAIPEYQTYFHVHDFLDVCEIKDGKAVAPNGKIRKVLFIGFDGMRPDSLPYILQNENCNITAYNSKLNFGGINDIAKKGGVYIAYCGGETGADTEQTTSTSSCWTSHFTGVWGNKHGIITNDDTKNMKYKTFALEYAEKGMNTCIAFEWDPFFDVNLKEEIKYAMQKSLPIKFCDIDRAKKAENSEWSKFNNYISPDVPSNSAPYDCGMRDYIISRIEADDDIICGIFENIDTAGHMFGFGASTQYVGTVINCDMYAYTILQTIWKREKELNEEWLVVFGNDHGGLGRGHGNQTLEERTTWIATNIPFDEKYYSKGYNGFTIKKG